MSLPALNYLSNAARTEGEQKVAFEDLNKGIKQVPGAGIADQALTIASGTVTPAAGASAVLVIDTEASGATDDLTNIVLTNIDDGAMVWARNANAARVVVAKHSAGGSGQLSLQSTGDFVLADPDKHWLLLKRNGTLLLEVARFPSADLAPLLSKSANYTTTPTDRGRFIDCTATLTLTLLAAAIAGKGYEQTIQCSGGVTTIDPNGAETIGGASTLLLYRGDKVRVVCDGTNWQVVDRHNAQVALDKTIQGLTYQINGTDPTNDIDIAAGVAMDSTGVYLLRGTAMTKQLDASWAPGNNAGMLDTGAVGNSDYYLWVIGRSDTGVVDYLASLSSTAPTMPANYDFKRLFGFVKRTAGANVAFRTYEMEGGGVELLWDSPTLEIDLANTLTTTRRTDAVKVPQNFSTIAQLSVYVADASATAYIWIACPDHTDVAPSSSASPLCNIARIGNATDMAQQMMVRTSSTGTIASRSSLATVDTYRVATIGFQWARRN